MNFCELYVKDKHSGKIHRVGDDRHDSLWVDSSGTVHYYNLQCGDGCGANSMESEGYGFCFLPLNNESEPDWWKEYVRQKKEEDRFIKQELLIAAENGCFQCKYASRAIDAALPYVCTKDRRIGFKSGCRDYVPKTQEEHKEEFDG